MNVLATPVKMEELVTIRSTSFPVLVQNNIPGPCAKMVIIIFILIYIKKNINYYVIVLMPVIVFENVPHIS